MSIIQAQEYCKLVLCDPIYDVVSSNCLRSCDMRKMRVVGLYENIVLNRERMEIKQLVARVSI